MLRKEVVTTMSDENHDLMFGYCHDLPEMIIYLCAAFYLEVFELQERLFEYTWVDSNDTNTGKLMIYQECISIFETAAQIKERLAAKHRARIWNMYICDIYKHRIFREYRSMDNLSTIDNNDYDDIFVYHVKPHEKCLNYPWSCLDVQTFYIRHETTNKESIGYPILLKLPLHIPITCNEICQELWRLVHPLLQNQDLKMDDDELPFRFHYGPNHKDIYPLPSTDKPFPLSGQDGLRFIVIWTDCRQMNTTQVQKKDRIRHISATDSK